MSSRSFSVGGFTRNVAAPSDPFSDRVMAFRNDDSSALSAEEQLTAEQIKTAERLAQANDQVTQNKIARGQNADAFLAAHPEVLDTAANTKLIVHELARMFGTDALYTIENYEAATDSLRRSGLLKINEAEAAKQKKEADKQRAAAATKAEPTLEELYNMPMEDLRRLDAGANQARMQRRGEEGGW